MKRRCKPDGHYGRKGIAVCDRWVSFENFLADMGERPDGTTIDRIDSEKGYEPGNCRWATPDVQFSNKRVIGKAPCAPGCSCGVHTPAPFTEEHRSRISAAKMGHSVSAETRAKISATKRARGAYGGPCPDGCTCGRHRPKPCPEGCTCGRHRRVDTSKIGSK